MMFARRTLAIAALALLLLTAALPAHLQTAAADSERCQFGTDSSTRFDCATLFPSGCRGCISCDTGYYLEQTYSEATNTYTGWCVQDTTSTEGCSNITATPILQIPEWQMSAHLPNPYSTHCLSCKNGYKLVIHTATDFIWGKLSYGVCVKDISVGPSTNAGKGYSTTAPAVLLLLSALVAALYTAL